MSQMEFEIFAGIVLIIFVEILVLLRISYRYHLVLLNYFKYLTIFNKNQDVIKIML